VPKPCTCCVHPKTAELSKTLTAGVPLSEVASRFGVTKTAAHRHLRNCLRISRRAEKPRGESLGARSGDSSRFESGRCHTCGTLSEDPTPAALVKRAEAALHRGETILDRALNDDDLRLALGALDRVRQSLDQLLKVHGLLQPDGGVSITVNGEALTLKKAFSIVTNAIEGERRQAEFVALFQAFYRGESYELPMTIDGDSTLVDVTDNRALPAAAAPRTR